MHCCEKFDSSEPNTAVNQNFFTILGLLITATVCALSSNNMCCGVRYTPFTSAMISLAALLFMTGGLLKNHWDRWNKMNRLIFVMIIAAVLTLVIGKILWALNDLKVCIPCKM